MKNFFARLFILGCLLLYTASAIEAAEKKDTTRVLFVGNSYVYYNNLIQMIGLITDSMHQKIICRKSVIGGATLGEHWNGLRGLKSKEAITEGKYQIVVIQDNSMWPIQHKDSLLLYGQAFAKLIKQSGSSTYLYNTWSRKNTPETQDIINAAYEELATKTGAIRVPIGACWAKARAEKPDMELFHTDGSHPSALGTFMIALGFVKSITGTLPKNYAKVYNYWDKDGESFRIMQLTDAEISFCTQIVNAVIPDRK
ncbi:MAG: hypothetical protein IBJ16_03015 [Chitinophagaceae bacterium]|nr:hypothetical protein [Chitinophagaceae bacterium]